MMNFTKEDRAFFSSVLILMTIFYLTGDSWLWMAIKALLMIGLYYLLDKSTITKNWSKVTKYLTGIILIILVMGGALLLPSNSSWRYRTSEYVQATNSFYQIDHSQIEERLQEQKKLIHFIYVGRESCPFCAEFAPKLKAASKQAKVSIYAVDTEDKSDELLTFADKYQITSIPTLLVFKNGELINKLENASNISIEDLTDFLKNNH